MSNYIASATRSKCVDCGGVRFKSVKTKYFKNNIPVCEKCEGGKSEGVLAELYGGDTRTMKKHYAKKRKQSLVGIYE